MGVYAFSWVDLAMAGSEVTKIMYADSIPYDTGKEKVDDINTVIFSHSGSGTAIVSTSLSLPGSSKPSFGDRFVATKLAPKENAQIPIAFPPTKAQQIKMQWYGRDHIIKNGIEIEETIEKPLPRG